MVRKVTRRMRRNPMTKMTRRFTTKRRMTLGMRTRMVRRSLMRKMIARGRMRRK